MADTCYLDASVSGVRWLLDPRSPTLSRIAREAEQRSTASPCDPDLLLADLASLEQLLAQRHFGLAVAAGSSTVSAVVTRVLTSWRARLQTERPGTWGDAIGQAADELRTALRDMHLAFEGGPPTGVRRAEPRLGEPGARPAVEVGEHSGVLLVRVRRLFGKPDDEAAIARWVADGAEHFAYERILVDLRGNDGGNDAHTLAWASDFIPEPFPDRTRSTGWYVGDTPLGWWNSAAWVEARDGVGAVPAMHLASRHTPRPEDRLTVRESPPGDEIPAGPHGWHGRMVVVTDVDTKSSGESSAWFLREAFGAVIVGGRSRGCIEFGNIVPYVFPSSGLVVRLPTKSNDFGIPVEVDGMPVDLSLDPRTASPQLAEDFDRIYARAVERRTA